MHFNVLFGVYPWAFDCPGGGERQLMAWKSHLQARGHKVTLHDPWQPVPADARIFHFFSVMPGSFQLCDYIKSKGLRLIISPNLWVTEDTKWHYPHDEIQRLVSIADLVIVNSRLEADALSGVYSLPPEKMHVVYNGVEQGFFENVDPEIFRTKFGLGTRKFLLNVANIESRKNQLSLLKALKDHPDLSLLVIGHARDEDYFRRCTELGGSQFTYVGPLPYGSDLIKSAMAAAEGFVMPSTLETPSIAALEAAAMGCRVLITRVGSTVEYFGDDVVYIDPADPMTISEGISRLLQQPRGRVRELIHQKFTWSSSVLSLSQAYDRVLA